MFSVRSEQHFGNIYLGGFGASVAEVRISVDSHPGISVITTH